jgi:hypothetical protein
VREDKGSGHVSVRGVRGRGVHYRGGERGRGRAAEKLDRYKHFPCLIFFLFIFYLRAILPVTLRFFLALILIRTNAITHPHSSSPNPSILLRPLQIPDPLPPLPFAFPVPDLPLRPISPRVPSLRLPSLSLFINRTVYADPDFILSPSQLANFFIYPLRIRGH